MADSEHAFPLASGPARRRRGGRAGRRLALLALLAALAVDFGPRLGPPPEARPADLAHVHELLRRHDPRQARAGALYAVRLTSADLAVLGDHAARTLGGHARFELGTQRLSVRASLPLSHFLPGPLWLNLESTLTARTIGLPHIEALRIGQLPVPAPLARWLAHRVLDWAEGPARGEPLHRMVHSVSIAPERLTVHYRWRSDAPGRVVGRLLPAPQRERLRRYTERLAQVTARGDDPIELTTLLAPLATLAVQHSADERAAVDENRAWLQALALYVSGRSLADLLPDERAWPRPRIRPVLLSQRGDFPLHFIVSALLAAEAGGPLADALGLAKEMDDSRFGSGFSFTDIAANRAGKRFGEFAVQSPRQLQAALAGGITTAALLPELGDLSEFMPEAEFVRRFDGVGSAAYKRVLADIDARVGTLALYR